MFAFSHVSSYGIYVIVSDKECFCITILIHDCFYLYSSQIVALDCANKCLSCFCAKIALFTSLVVLVLSASHLI